MQWSTAASQRRNALEANFKTNLRQIADCLAAHDEAAQIAPTHVNRAFEVLANAGLHKRTWIDRPEAEASVGAFLIGFSFSCPTVIGALFEDSNKAIAQTTLLVSFIVGILMMGHAWYRGKLPATPEERTAGIVWSRRILLVVVMVAIVLAIACMIYFRFLQHPSPPDPNQPIPTL